MTQFEQNKTGIERLANYYEEHISSVRSYAQRLYQILSFIESKEKEPHDAKRNEPFDKCVANADPETMKEVSKNIDRMLDEPKIKGWVARDENGELYVHYGKPYRKSTIWLSTDNIPVPEESFPDLKWEDEPIEVELEIHKV